MAEPRESPEDLKLRRLGDSGEVGKRHGGKRVRDVVASDDSHLRGPDHITPLLHEDVPAAFLPHAVVLTALGTEGDVGPARLRSGLPGVVVREAPFILAVRGDVLGIPEDAVLCHAVLLEAPLIAVKVILGYVEADRADGLKA